MGAGQPHPSHRAWSAPAAALRAALADDAPLPGPGLKALLEGLRREAPAGVWHPTGFLVLALLGDELGALRLHLWPAGAREHGQPCWPVHDHTWDLRSHVLCGVVRSQQVEVHDDPAGEHRLYAVDYVQGHRSAMRSSDRRVRVQARPAREVPAGGRYEVAAGAFHTSRVVLEALAATLVVTRPTDRAHPWVVGPADGPAVVPVERPVAPADQVRAVLARVEAALG